MNIQFYIIRKKRNGQFSYLLNENGERVSEENAAKKFKSRQAAVNFYDEHEVYNMDNGAWSVVPQVYDINPIHLFNMFALNYPHDFIQKVWEGSPEHIIGHIVTKFHSAYNVSGSYGAMLKFWAELDGGHREKLENWIIENYKG